MPLPLILINKASLVGLEYAWRVDDFPMVLTEAMKHQLACIGGQFQFRFPDGTAEMYWLKADSTPQRQNESWFAYAVRSTNEVGCEFHKLCSQTDFAKEAMKWDFIRNKMEFEGINPIEYLCFVAYFIEENDTF